MTTGLSLGNTLQLIFAVLLLILGVIVAIQGIKNLQRRKNKQQYKSTTYVQQQDDPCSFSTNHTGTVIEFHHGYRGYDDG